VFVLAKEDDLPGKFVKQGELLGFVVDGSANIVRVVVAQDDIDLVRRSTQRIDVRFASRIGEVVEATSVREVPSANKQLPSLALSTEGGGLTPLDPRDPDKNKALASLFQFDLALPKLPGGSYFGLSAPYGSRVYVRFDHRSEPMAGQLMRRLRQLFLSQMNV
jgi:putative peptide zinc metalloprotease protein